MCSAIHDLDEFFDVHNTTCFCTEWSSLGTARVCTKCGARGEVHVDDTFDGEVRANMHHWYCIPSSSSARLNALDVERGTLIDDAEFWSSRTPADTLANRQLARIRRDMSELVECAGHLFGWVPYEVPDEARTGDESEAAIYGDAHSRLLDAIQGHVETMLRNMPEGKA